MASASARLVVLARVREALFNLRDRHAGGVAVTHQQRQIASHTFEYVDVKAVTDEELVDILSDDIATALEQLDESKRGTRAET